jgi:hypothetical protein
MLAASGEQSRDHPKFFGSTGQRPIGPHARQWYFRHGKRAMAFLILFIGSVDLRSELAVRNLEQTVQSLRLDLQVFANNLIRHIGIPQPQRKRMGIRQTPQRGFVPIGGLLVH